MAKLCVPSLSFKDTKVPFPCVRSGYGGAVSRIESLHLKVGTASWVDGMSLNSELTSKSTGMKDDES